MFGHIRKLYGLTERDLLHKNKRKFFGKMSRSDIPNVNQRVEKREFRDAMQDMAKDGKGITVREAADQVTKWKYGTDDHLSKREVSHGVQKFFKELGVKKGDLRRAKHRYLETLKHPQLTTHKEEHSQGIAKPYGQRDDERSVFGGHTLGEEGGGHPSSFSPVHIPSRPMF